MTDGKARQKRNGPGGSGCFHAFCYFLHPAGAGGLCVAEAGRRELGARFPAKPLLFRRRAPRLWGQRRCRRAGRGASLPANPCSFVDGHHVFGVKGAAGELDVVLHSPQSLALSSTGTTSLGPKAPPASRTWCFNPRNPLLFRRRAPRLWDQRRRRRAGRGASLPTNPCSFVDGHHVFGAKGAAGISSHQYKSQKEKIDDGTSGESVPSSISIDFNRNSWN